jgi:Domain of unknown function (DUF4314)
MTPDGTFERGDRIVLEHTDDEYTQLRSGDLGTVTGYDAARSELYVRWDSGSTLTMLLGSGDRVRLVTVTRVAGGTSCHT